MRSNLAAVIPSQTVGQRTGQSESKLCRHGSALWREGKQCGQRSAPLRVARKGVRCAEGFLLRSGPRAGLPGPAAWWTQRACTWHSANTRVTAKGAGIGHPENRGVAEKTCFRWSSRRAIRIRSPPADLARITSSRNLASTAAGGEFPSICRDRFRLKRFLDQRSDMTNRTG